MACMAQAFGSRDVVREGEESASNLAAYFSGLVDPAFCGSLQDRSTFVVCLQLALRGALMVQVQGCP